MIASLSIIIIFLYLLYLRFNFYNYQVAFLIPWLLIIIFSFIKLSILHININEITLFIIIIFLFSYLLGSLGSRLSLFKNKKLSMKHYVINKYISKRNFFILLNIFIGLTLLNIILAGYIPFFRLLLTGSSGYLHFGISGLYGFYLAFSNALGVLSYYLYIKTNNKLYLYVVFLIFFVFFIFLTRQNMISLATEIFVVHGFTRGFVSSKKIFFLSLATLLFFSYIGDLRSGDIKEIIEANEKYQWLPSFIFWMYGYFYFSAINLNNLINYTSAPYFDFSSFSRLMPNFVKHLIGFSQSHEFFLQKINFNVSTALSEIYGDMGIYEVIFFGLFAGFITSYFYKKVQFQKDNFKYLSIYSVLYFCSFFSFFINFWFYLPIIFQIVFFLFFYKFIFKTKVIHYAKNINNNTNI